MQEVRDLWSWLGANAGDDWGRVYLQDTYWTPHMSPGLFRSHILARTSAETGVRQLGVGYSAVPFPTASWVAGEFGWVFGLHVRSLDELKRLLAAAERSNTAHLVTCQATLSWDLAGTGGFDELYRSRLFTVFRVRHAMSHWVEARGTRDAAGSRFVPIDDRAVDYGIGRIAIDASSLLGGCALRVKESHHPFWKLHGVPDASLEADEWGLIRITDLPPGTGRVELRYEPPDWPLWTTLAMWAGILAGLALPRCRSDLFPRDHEVPEAGS
jgi:hypothetical protein